MRKQAIYPDSKGVLHTQPIDPETDKEMVGFVENQRRSKGGKQR
ncbi:MAG: hypothetical protein ABR985_00640 [Methanotrichaceae archaeon]|jgi:hypothetical protein